MKTTLLLLTFLSLHQVSFAQDVTTKTVSWNSTETHEVSAAQRKSENTKLIVHKKEKIEWVDATGKTKYAFTIKTTSGSLVLDQPGEMVYQVTGEELTGTIVIFKKNGTTKARLMLNSKGALQIIELTISNYNQI